MLRMEENVFCGISFDDELTNRWVYPRLVSGFVPHNNTLVSEGNYTRRGCTVMLCLFS